MVVLLIALILSPFVLIDFFVQTWQIMPYYPNIFLFIVMLYILLIDRKEPKYNWKVIFLYIFILSVGTILNDQLLIQGISLFSLFVALVLWLSYRRGMSTDKWLKYTILLFTSFPFAGYVNMLVGPVFRSLYVLLISFINRLFSIVVTVNGYDLIVQDRIFRIDIDCSGVVSMLLIVGIVTTVGIILESKHVIAGVVKGILAYIGVTVMHLWFVQYLFLFTSWSGVSTPHSLLGVVAAVVGGWVGIRSISKGSTELDEKWQISALDIKNQLFDFVAVIKKNYIFFVWVIIICAFASFGLGQVKSRLLIDSVVREQNECILEIIMDMNKAGISSELQSYNRSVFYEVEKYENEDVTLILVASSSNLLQFQSGKLASAIGGVFSERTAYAVKGTVVTSYIYNDNTSEIHSIMLPNGNLPVLLLLQGPDRIEIDRKIDSLVFCLGIEESLAK